MNAKMSSEEEITMTESGHDISDVLRNMKTKLDEFDIKNLSFDKLNQVYENALREKAALEREKKFFEAHLTSYFLESELKGSKELAKVLKNPEEYYMALQRDLENVKKKTIDYEANSELKMKKLEEILKQKEEKFKEKFKAFYKLKRFIAEKAVHSSTGKSIPPEKIDYYIRKEQFADKAIKKAKEDFIEERNAIQKEKIRKMECLSNNESMGLNEYKLATIDTQTYRNHTDKHREEIEAINTKCWKLINIITHLKLKLHYLKTLTCEANEKLNSLNDEVSVMNEGILDMKQKCEVITTRKTQELKKKSMILQDDLLPEDYIALLNEDKVLTEQFEQLKIEYSEVLKLLKK